MRSSFDLEKIYANRFDEEARASKEVIWKTLCQYFFQRYIQESDTVLDLGAGYCEFINNIECAEKIAVDLNPELENYADPGIKSLISPIHDLSPIQSDTVDVIFASNIFEHLPDTSTFIQSLEEGKRVLRHAGRILILQPNIRILGGKYWDFIDHHLPLTDRSIVEALSYVGMNVVEVLPRFLPYSTKSLIPKNRTLIRIYLKFSILQRMFGSQAWVVGTKT